MTEEDAPFDGEAVVLPIEDWIDLHTFPPDEVASVISEYLREAVRHGFEHVRIVHGRGIGVQREIVRSILRAHPDVISFADMPDRGSTTARLRVTAGHAPG